MKKSSRRGVKLNVSMFYIGRLEEHIFTPVRSVKRQRRRENTKRHVGVNVDMMPLPVLSVGSQ